METLLDRASITLLTLNPNILIRPNPVPETAKRVIHSVLGDKLRTIPLFTSATWWIKPKAVEINHRISSNSRTPPGRHAEFFITSTPVGKRKKAIMPRSHTRTHAQLHMRKINSCGLDGRGGQFRSPGDIQDYHRASAICFNYENRNKNLWHSALALRCLSRYHNVWYG